MNISSAAFAEDYWDRAPLLTRAKDLPGDFDDLLCAADVDSLVGQRGLRQPFFRMIDQGHRVGKITRSGRAGSQSLTDLADPEAMRREFEAGATLVLQSLHRMWPTVAEFCRALAAELGHSTQCNAYITPGGDAHGLDFHHDTHDVFVLQVAGTKRWVVHQPIVALPTTRQSWSSVGDHSVSSPPLLDIELSPGDCLYLPRGYVHAASTGSEPSVHLTIGVHPTTWYDVLRDVTSLASDDLEFRRALPLDPISTLASDPERLGAFLRQTADWLEHLPTERLSALVDRRLSRATVAEPVGLLAAGADAAACGPLTRVRPRRGLRWSIELADDRAVLSLPDRTIDVPVLVASMVRRVMSAPAVVIELVGDDVDEASAVVVVRRLIREGAIVVDHE